MNFCFSLLVSLMMQPKEEAKPEPAAEEKPAPTLDLPEALEAVRPRLPN